MPTQNSFCFRPRRSVDLAPTSAPNTVPHSAEPMTSPCMTGDSCHSFRSPFLPRRSRRCQIRRKGSGERPGQGPENETKIPNADSVKPFVTHCDDSVLFGNRNGTGCQLFVTDCNIHEDVVTAHQDVLDPQTLYAQWHRHATKFCDVEVRSFRANEWLA